MVVVIFRFLLGALIALNAPALLAQIVSIADYGIPANSRTDATPAVAEALSDCQGNSGCTVVFPTGVYHFWPDRAAERLLFVSNNDGGLRRIVFPLTEFEDLTIDGRGSEFIFHGQLIPFVIDSASSIELRSFSVDWEVPFHCEGEVLAVDLENSTVDVRIFDGFSYRIADNRFVFAGEGFENHKLKNLLEFDPLKRETAYRVFDNFQRTTPHHVEEIAPRTLRFNAQFRNLPKPGNTLLVLQDMRISPAIFIADSRGVAVTDVTIHHSGAMGVIGQRSSDITLRRVRVTPRPGSGRLVSTTVDATHFVDCGGQILVEDSLFENQIDDALNVHGIYTEIAAQPAPDAIEIRLMHYQQQGITIADAGAELEFVSSDSLEAYHTGRVKSVERINSKYSRVTFEQPLPEAVKPGDVVESLRWQPDVTLRNSVIRRNRARGILLKSRGKILIENNRFHTPGAAVRISGGLSRWFESGPVHDVTIRDNVFENCNYGVWGNAVIDISAGAKDGPGSNSYHRNITIEDNLFRTFDKWLVSAQGVDGLRFIGNKVEKTNTYPPYQEIRSALVITNSRNVHVEGNRFTSLGYQAFDFDELADLDEHTRRTATIRGLPRVTLSNGELELLIMPPDSRTGYYRGVRFDASGIIAQAAYGGHTYFQGTEKTSSSRGTGTIEEFRAPVGYDDAAPGEPFLKVGVGVLRRDEKPYRHSTEYGVVERGEWTVTAGDLWMQFEQTVNTAFGYAYTYRKKITLLPDRPEFTIDHEFTNTGSKPIRTNNYCHNFIRFDERPVSPDYAATFNGGLKTPDMESAFYQIDGYTLRPSRELADGETYGIPITTNYDITVSNRSTETGIHITGDRPLSSLYFYSWRGAMSPEPYVDVNVEAGKSMTWQTRYSFTAPSVDR